MRAARISKTEDHSPVHLVATPGQTRVIAEPGGSLVATIWNGDGTRGGSFEDARRAGKMAVGAIDDT